MIDELAALNDGGCGFVVGTVAADGTPRAARAWGAEVVGGSDDRIRFVVSADDPVVVENLRNEFVCLNGAHVMTFRSVQWKGRIVAVEPPTADDRASAEAHTGRFYDAVAEIDQISLELLDRLRPHATLTVEMVVEEVYDQTPGPRAGEAIGKAP